ncbi:Mrp complex subunit A, sodium/proton antiporter subunit [Alkalihalophilus pseudofirmus OF4]|uniref:Na(+)/H(+) antiporter subunit A n=1 Tax=Alkalihalophilus pseudofirmus (strain ATCC BAA-2126 / JCM 17055 / OF4) TaxID=398511 RepID=MRPA_ALKPO|nr:MULTISPECIES: Na+/H+ antiporter subunit A [Alkalihalophilus]Q9RGZ5.2 RecName: Full=Na(+)/H(+) antiporter subunit A; AltName: Full=Mrp complex subunit A; AltName: Full=Multiple resistance and pH homeostasis protein A [Alkalihalophilus pseudofirmus OF4]AAF21812.2 multiple resistance and pH regulation related protein A [Cytobacillus firmus]ADC50693.1 Mrp complex subunit A, sodium/proton antiporter subunit [Alkalihalophilus pseudofirmus OF4]MED1602555.1 Na+/H+ antiporter subunit A [Alkalihalophi
MTVLHWATISPFLLAILIPFLYKYARRIHTGWFVLVLPLVLFIYFIQYLSITSTGGVVEHTIPWVPSLGINFTVFVDGLSLLFALLITGIGTLVILYSIFYLSKKTESLNNFYVYLLMFMGAMLGVVLSDNLIVLYVFWELTSLASSLLISYWFHREKSTYGAQKSMLITVFGGFAMLGGFSLLYVMTGTFSIRGIIENVDLVTSSELFLPAMILVLLGAFTKSAQFPFHIWLPDAMEAPTPVSAYLHSATMVKAGIYLVARLTPVFAGSAEWFWLLTGFGVVTLLWGSTSAVRQKDLKGILAFSTVSQLGLIMTLLGLGSAAIYFGESVDPAFYSFAIMAAIFHLINHATFKGSLFMTAGIIDHETGTRDIRKLGGLMAIMPVTFTVSLIGLASMAGLPPFNGFLSKEMFFTALLRATEMNAFNMETFGIIIVVLAWIASVFTFLYCLIMFFKTFTGKFKPENYDVKVHEAPIGMLISPVILGSLVIVFGFFPNILAYTIIEPAMQAVLPTVLADGELFHVNIYMWHGFNAELFMTMGVVAAGIILFLMMKNWAKAAFYMKERDPLNWFYDSSLSGVITGSQFVTRIQMTGLLRDYFAYMIVFMILLLGYTMFRYDAFAIDTTNVTEIAPYIWVITIVFIVATLSIPFINKRITAVVVVGVIGFLLALLFVVFRAPDLALTQLLIETVTVLLLMLAFYHLPELRKEEFKPRFNVLNLIISIGVGFFITAIALSSLALGNEAGIEPISQFFIENSKELAGGYNMVNVILVDFRGLDTMLEVLVLGIAALGVIALIKLRMTGREDV